MECGENDSAVPGLALEWPAASAFSLLEIWLLGALSDHVRNPATLSLVTSVKPPLLCKVTHSTS